MPRADRLRRRPLPAATRNEAFRVLRSNVLVSLAALDHATVIVTSAVAEEGKTSTTANLAMSLAAAGVRVVAADFDLRHPDLHSWFDTHNEVGLSDVLLQRADLDEALRYVPLRSGTRGLYVLPAGSTVNNATELIGTPRSTGLLRSLAQQADVVLLDTPPVLPVADTLVLGRVADGAVLVVASRSTPTTAVLRAKDALTRNQTRLLGVVLNKVQPRDAAGFGYGYGYGGGNDEDEDAERA